MAQDPDAGSAGLQRTRIADLPVVTADRQQLVEAMIVDCRRAQADRSLRAKLVFDLNGHAISMAAKDPAYREALDAADIIHADGRIWVTLSRLTRAPIAERSSTTDLMIDFAEACEIEGLSFYVLGGSETVNATFCDFLARNYPRLRVAGRHHGYFCAAEHDRVIADISNARPDVVWVGLGKPLEQQFSVMLREKLRTGWIVTCGGCYNYFVGEYTRAPLWMQNAGLEWLYRSITEPRKFAWRYIKTNPHSLALGLWHIAHPGRSGEGQRPDRPHKGEVA